MRSEMNRRDFLKGSLAGALSAGIMAHMPVLAEQPDAVAWDDGADVVVLGLGGAGASAAIEASDSGASVLILEKQSEAGHVSNTRMSGGYIHNPDPSGDRTARVEYIRAMMSGENCPWKLEGEAPEVSQAMAEMFADGVMEAADFLTAQAPELDPSCLKPTGTSSFPTFPSFEAAKYGASPVCLYRNFTRADPSKKSYQQEDYTCKGHGEAFHWALIEQGIKEKRPQIRILYETPAKALIRNADGEVIGVTASSAGKTLRIRAGKGVVLATGGFEYNTAMRRAFLEGPGVKGWSFYGSPYNTGDGIAMGMLAGAGLSKVGKCASRIEMAVPAGYAWEHYGLKQGVACAVTSSPNSFIVDNTGRRYADESIITDSARPYRYQFYHEAVRYELLEMCFSRDPSWLIFDEQLRSAKCVAVTAYSAVAYDLIGWSQDNRSAIENGWILKADSLEELAGKIRADEENRGMMDASVLTETAERFNGFCASGEDADFGRLAGTMGPVRQGPFYAVKLYPGGPNTKGGLAADAERRVLDWDGNPIPRLYTAGEISSVFKFTYQAGGNLTECIVCGRAAGKNAAAEESWA